MKYSIIIPTYNVENYILNCLNSIDEILPENAEVILVDDGSLDSTVTLVQEFIADKQRYNLIKNFHGGVSKARNTALDIAEGDFICFIDSDDLIEKNYFEMLDQQLDDSIEIFHFNYTNFNERVWKNKEQLSYEGTGKGFLCHALLQDKYSTAICMHVFKKDFFDKNKIRFIEGIYHEDEEFNIHCMLIANKIKSCNDYAYLYRIHDKSITQNIEYAAERTKSKFFIYDKYKSFFSFEKDEVYVVLCTYLSVMLLLEIAKYPNNSKEFKELRILYRNSQAIDMINTNIILYKILKGLYKINDLLVYNCLKVIKGIKR